MKKINYLMAILAFVLGTSMMLSCSETSSKADLKKKKVEKNIAKRLKLDKQQTVALRTYLNMKFEAKKMMKDTKKEYHKNLNTLFLSDNFSPSKASGHLSEMMNVKKQLLNQKMAALKAFHETLKSDQRQQWSTFLLSKKNRMGKKGHDKREGKEHHTDKKEKLFQALNVEAGKKQAFSKALEDSMTARIALMKHWRSFEQTLFTKVAEDSFDHSSLVGPYLKQMAPLMQNTLIAKQTIHSLLTPEQRSQMVSMMKKRFKKKCKTCADGKACKKCKAKKSKKNCKTCADGEVCEKCKAKKSKKT